ncbi:hypothetical protein A6F68_00927 [Tsuneonella dongtanensis]|uniref:DUF2155 domain-containing protein n=1 Tax=Tsuneonella dongtanensis TaxID=692370 RepID=A0A1B2ABA4_9SPHN|nr:hypothetical protein A6F68_00927 [Tsuneonella dongtanensis]
MEPGRLIVRRASVVLVAGALAACTQQPPDPRPVETEVPEELRAPKMVEPVEKSAGTPMKDRVALIGVLNKRNNLSQTFEMKPGEAKRWGEVIVRLAACERTAPWEFPRQTGAFTQVFVRAAGGDGDWNKAFSGWMFKEAPSINVLEHPIYDVWVKDCRMSFDGGKPPASDSASSAPNASGSGAAPAPSPSAEASPSNAT